MRSDKWLSTASVMQNESRYGIALFLHDSKLLVDV